MLAKITNDLDSLPSGFAAALLSSGGDAARMRAAQYERAQMRGLAPLWKNTQEMIDQAVVRVGREGLVIAADRISQFSVPLPEWLGVLELTSHKVGESRAANRGMVPGSKPDGGGLQNKTPYTLPIYVTWDEFSFNVRELAAASRFGRPLSTDEVEQATRNVNYAIEDATINGLTAAVAGNTIPGMLSTTNTQQYSGSNKAWDHASKTSAEILTDVLAMRAVLAADKFYGPYTLYVPTAYGAALQKPFEASGVTGLTRQRYLEQLVFGGRNLRIMVADLLPTDRTLLVQDTNQVCDVIVGQTPIAINPAPEVEFHTKFLVYAVIVPRIKSDINSNFGICAGDVN
jgi:uncharacterized linocin/CFP29 family protein